MSTKRGREYEVDFRGPVPLGGIDQWIHIRAKNAKNPVLILLQQGPGLPMLSEVHDLSKLWRLEEEFVVVYWDLRGCGLSYSPAIPPESMTLVQMVEDTAELIEQMAKRFDTAKVYLAGFSVGATVAAQTAYRFPHRVRAVVAVGIDIDLAAAEHVAYDFAVAQATLHRNKNALKELRRIGPPPHLDSTTFNTRVKWVATYHGANRQKNYGALFRTFLRQILTSYSPSGIAKTLRGLSFAIDHLLPDMADLDLFRTLPRLEVPICMLQGRHDQVAPAPIAEKYYRALETSSEKQLIWFEESAHSPQYEEPAKFRETLLSVKRRFES